MQHPSISQTHSSSQNQSSTENQKKNARWLKHPCLYSGSPCTSQSCPLENFPRMACVGEVLKLMGKPGWQCSNSCQRLWHFQGNEFHHPCLKDGSCRNGENCKFTYFPYHACMQTLLFHLGEGNECSRCNTDESHSREFYHVKLDEVSSWSKLVCTEEYLIWLMSKQKTIHPCSRAQSGIPKSRNDCGGPRCPLLMFPRAVCEDDAMYHLGYCTSRCAGCTKVHLTDCFFTERIVPDNFRTQLCAQGLCRGSSCNFAHCDEDLRQWEYDGSKVVAFRCSARLSSFQMNRTLLFHPCANFKILDQSCPLRSNKPCPFQDLPNRACLDFLKGGRGCPDAGECKRIHCQVLERGSEKWKEVITPYLIECYELAKLADQTMRPARSVSTSPRLSSLFPVVPHHPLPKLDSPDAALPLSHPPDSSSRPAGVRSLSAGARLSSNPPNSPMVVLDRQALPHPSDTSCRVEVFDRQGALTTILEVLINTASFLSVLRSNGGDNHKEDSLVKLILSIQDLHPCLRKGRQCKEIVQECPYAKYPRASCEQDLMPSIKGKGKGCGIRGCKLLHFSRETSTSYVRDRLVAWFSDIDLRNMELFEVFQTIIDRVKREGFTEDAKSQAELDHTFIVRELLHNGSILHRRLFLSRGLVKRGRPSLLCGSGSSLVIWPDILVTQVSSERCNVALVSKENTSEEEWEYELSAMICASPNGRVQLQSPSEAELGDLHPCGLTMLVYTKHHHPGIDDHRLPVTLAAQRTIFEEAKNKKEKEVECRFRGRTAITRSPEMNSPVIWGDLRGITGSFTEQEIKSAECVLASTGVDRATITREDVQVSVAESLSLNPDPQLEAAVEILMPRSRGGAGLGKTLGALSNQKAEAAVPAAQVSPAPMPRYSVTYVAPGQRKQAPVAPVARQEVFQEVFHKEEATHIETLKGRETLGHNVADACLANFVDAPDLERTPSTFSFTTSQNENVDKVTAWDAASIASESSEFVFDNKTSIASNCDPNGANPRQSNQAVEQNPTKFRLTALDCAKLVVHEIEDSAILGAEFSGSDLNIYLSKAQSVQRLARKNMVEEFPFRVTTRGGRNEEEVVYGITSLTADDISRLLAKHRNNSLKVETNRG